jgi:hypothetical protein
LVIGGPQRQREGQTSGARAGGLAWKAVVEEKRFTLLRRRERAFSGLPLFRRGSSRSGTPPRLDKEDDQRAVDRLPHITRRRWEQEQQPPPCTSLLLKGASAAAALVHASGRFFMRADQLEPPLPCPPVLGRAHLFLLAVRHSPAQQLSTESLSHLATVPVPPPTQLHPLEPIPAGGWTEAKQARALAGTIAFSVGTDR